MFQRRILIAGLAVSSLVGLQTTAFAQNWKSQYPELFFFRSKKKFGVDKFCSAFRTFFSATFGELFSEVHQHIQNFNFSTALSCWGPFVWYCCVVRDVFSVWSVQLSR